MKYSETDLQCEDIMWFGVDINGYIFECTSGGVGCVPSFVCNSRENTETLEKFFLEELKQSTHGNLIITNEDNLLTQDAVIISGKGIFCFDVALDDGRPDEYKKIAIPSMPISLEKLPENIQNIMNNHRITIDVAKDSYIKVPHAY